MFSLITRLQQIIIFISISGYFDIFNNKILFYADISQPLRGCDMICVYEILDSKRWVQSDAVVIWLFRLFLKKTF